MKKVLVLSPMEYGSLIDHVKWCEYLSERYEVTHISQSKDEESVITISNTRIIKIKKIQNNLLKNKILFIKYINKFIKQNNFDCIIIDYFPGCSIIKLFNIRKKIILDIRTSTISKNKYKKNIRDCMISIESKIFNKVTIISNDVGKKLNIKKSKSYELPLGATVVVSKESLLQKDKSVINLLYVGTFNERKIDTTIYAVKRYIEKNKKSNIFYNIIGFSDDNSQEKILEDIIKTNKLQNNIKLIGKVSHDKLYSYYEKHNVGISFIPMEDHFDLQPPTKTYEYIMNGLFCLATNTKANKEIINSYNGILVNDDIDSIVEGLELIYEKITRIDYKNVQRTVIENNWENIIKSRLIPIIEETIFNYKK